MAGIPRDEVRRVVRDVLGEFVADEAPASAAPAAKAAGPRWELARFHVGEPGATPAREKQGGGRLRVAIGSDHGGFALKRTLLELLREMRIEAVDVGTHSTDSCDYPDFAVAVGRLVRAGKCQLGIMIDGAGIGSAMALNKLRGVRAATVHSEATAINSREHNDANVLVLGSAQMHSGHARRITRIWLSTEHAGGRHARRVAKIDALDEGRA